MIHPTLTTQRHEFNSHHLLLFTCLPEVAGQELSGSCISKQFYPDNFLSRLCEYITQRRCANEAQPGQPLGKGADLNRLV